MKTITIILLLSLTGCMNTGSNYNPTGNNIGESYRRGFFDAYDRAQRDHSQYMNNYAK